MHRRIKNTNSLSFSLVCAVLHRAPLNLFCDATFISAIKYSDAFESCALWAMAGSESSSSSAWEGGRCPFTENAALLAVSLWLCSPFHSSSEHRLLSGWHAGWTLRLCHGNTPTSEEHGTALRKVSSSQRYSGNNIKQLHCCTCVFVWCTVT